MNEYLDINREYARILQFYSQQSHFLDEGEYDSWSKTFTEDGVFVFNNTATKGREMLFESAKTNNEKSSFLRRRHYIQSIYIKNTTLDFKGEVRFEVAGYALVVTTLPNGTVSIQSHSMFDTVAKNGSSYLVAERKIYSDRQQ